MSSQFSHGVTPLSEFDDWLGELRKNNPVGDKPASSQTESSSWRTQINSNNKTAVYDVDGKFTIQAIHVVRERERENAAMAEIKKPRFVRIFHLYVFSGLPGLAGGVWETFAVEGLTGFDPQWSIRVVAVTDSRLEIGQSRSLPQSIIEEFGAEVTRYAFRGTRMSVWAERNGQPEMPIDVFFRKFCNAPPGSGNEERIVAVDELVSKKKQHERLSLFGSLVWDFICKEGSDFCGSEFSEDILPLAQRAGLCRRVVYDPEIHGDNVEADPGSEIWWWGPEKNVLPGVTSKSIRTFHKTGYSVDVLSDAPISESFSPMGADRLLALSQHPSAIVSFRKLYGATLSGPEMAAEIKSIGGDPGKFLLTEEGADVFCV